MQQQQGQQPQQTVQQPQQKQAQLPAGFSFVRQGDFQIAKIETSKDAIEQPELAKHENMYIPPLGSSVVISGKFGSGKSTLLANLLLDGRFYGPGTLKPKGWFEKIFLFSFTEGLGVTWNSLRFVAVGQGTNSIAYSTNGITWFGLGTSIFTVIVGIGVNSNVGATIVDSAIVLRNNNINKIDIVADGYYNGGWSNMTAVVKSTIL